MPAFKDILGHEREKGLLRRALEGGRLAHAYIFAGTSGIGKMRAALALSAVLNCPNAKGGDSCGTCPDCEKVEKGAHENVVVVWPTDKDGGRDDNGLIRVGQIRELQDTLKYRVERGKKVAIVEAADKMMPEAANAFLKTLEEPPPDSLIVLMTSRPAYLLPTILSRCQRINMLPLSEETVRGYLVRERGVAAEEAALAARMSAGSLGRALNYVDTGALEKRRGLVKRLRSLKDADTPEVLALAEELSRLDDVEEALEFLKTVVRDMAAIRAGVPSLIVNMDMEDLLKEGRSGLKELVSSYEMIEAVRYDVTPPRYANKQLAMEAMLLRLKEAGAIV